MVKSEQIDDLLIQFGLSLFIAQSIEYNMVTLLAIARASGEFETKMTNREIMNKYFLKTMGGIKKEFCKQLSLSSTLIIKLDETLIARNWLAHNFYREYAMAGFNKDVFDVAVVKLKKVISLFEETNELLNETIYLKTEVMGYTREMIDDIDKRAQALEVDDILPADRFWDEKLCKKGWS